MYAKQGLPMFYGARAKLFQFARRMRDAPTAGEAAMWTMLSNTPLNQYKFRRQHPISTFIADFYCHDLKLVIEIDGDYHLGRDQAEYDIFRDEDMSALGISVLRFTNDDVLHSNEIITENILSHILNTEYNPKSLEGL